MAYSVAIFFMSIIITIILYFPEATPVEQVKYMVNEASLLVSVMVDQPIIWAAMSSIETFDGNKNKFETWIASVENVAQISGQDILEKAFSKMQGHHSSQSIDWETGHQT